MASINANPIVADYYAMDENLNWQQYYFKTTTDAIIEEDGTTKKLVTQTGTPDLYAIEALSGTSGILTKTAANTWSLDTTVYASQAWVSGQGYLTALSVLDPTKLDATKKVPLECIPDSVLQQNEYCGVWDASVNTNTLAHTLRKGDMYKCQVAGIHNPDNTTSGLHNYNIGDWAIYNGSSWDQIDSSEAVASVNGQTGAVVLTAASVGAVSSTENNESIQGDKFFYGKIRLGADSNIGNYPIITSDIMVGVDTSDTVFSDYIVSFDSTGRKISCNGFKYYWNNITPFLTYNLNETVSTGAVPQEFGLMAHGNLYLRACNMNPNGGTTAGTIYFEANEFVFRKRSRSGSTPSNSQYAGIFHFGHDSHSYIPPNYNALTADRTYTFPDKSGTVALDSDIPKCYTSADDPTSVAGGSYTCKKGDMWFKPTSNSNS